jgi:ABC-type transport system involved in cytochrome c biogenesis ATPase subunit
MLTRLEAYRYRCFSRLAIDVGGFNVLAGANGAGKTTLLDIPIVLGDLLAQRTCSAAFLEVQPSRGAPRAHNLRDLIYLGRGESFVLAIEAELPTEVQRVLLEASTDAVRDETRR